VLHAAADLYGFYALGKVTFELSRRQKVREEWVRGGSTAGLPDDFSPRLPQAAVLPAYPAARPAPAPAPAWPAAAAAPQPGLWSPGPAPSPVGAKPAFTGPISTELPPDDMTPDWSRPVFSTKAVPVELPPTTWTQSPVIPTAQVGATPPAWARDDLPEEWRRAVGQSTPPPMAPFDRRLADQPRTGPVAPAGPDTAPADRPVIQPSAANFSRYRAPVPPAAPEAAEPAPEPPADPSLDHGI